MCLLLSFQSRAIANATNDKGEAVVISASPLLYMLQQEKDTLLKLKFQQVKKLYKEENYSKTLEQGLLLLNKVEKEDDKKQD